MTKQYLVSTSIIVNIDVGIYEAESDEEAIQKAAEDIEEIRSDIEFGINHDGLSEVVVDNHYTESV